MENLAYGREELKDLVLKQSGLTGNPVAAKLVTHVVGKVCQNNGLLTRGSTYTVTEEIVGAMVGLLQRVCHSQNIQQPQVEVASPQSDLQPQELEPITYSPHQFIKFEFRGDKRRSRRHHSVYEHDEKIMDDRGVSYHREHSS